MVYVLVFVVGVAIAVAMWIVFFTMSIERVFYECGYLLDAAPQFGVLSRFNEFYLRVQFARWLSEKERKKIGLMAKCLFGAKVTESLSKEYNNGYQDLVLKFVFTNSDDAARAMKYFMKCCHSIGY